MTIDTEFQCAYCGAINATTIDPSAGRHQEYVEDCQTCCRPNFLRITLNPDSDTAEIDAEVEN